LINIGCGIRKLDGSVIWHCGKHSPEDILKSMNGVPAFTTFKKEENE
jgi:hypothetical protein